MNFRIISLSTLVIAAMSLTPVALATSYDNDGPWAKHQFNHHPIVHQEQFEHRNHRGERGHRGHRGHHRDRHRGHHRDKHIIGGLIGGVILSNVINQHRDRHNHRQHYQQTDYRYYNQQPVVVNKTVVVDNTPTQTYRVLNGSDCYLVNVTDNGSEILTQVPNINCGF